MCSAVAVFDPSHGMILRGTGKQWVDITDIAVLDVSLTIAERHGRELSKTGKYDNIELMCSAVAVFDPSQGMIARRAIERE
jgi:hypothetical protein